jgi:NitT/TauT family transport system substrate-binding protein
MRFTPLGRITLVIIILALGLGTYVAWKYWRPGPGNDSLPPPTPLAPDEIAEICSKTLLGRPLRVGIVTWPGYAGGIVANNGFKPDPESIYYKRYNLCVEFLLMEDVDARAKAFARGGQDGVDVVWSTVDFWANELPGFLETNLNARAIMQVDWSRGGDAIVADNSIKSIEDLRGRRVSLALFTPSHWLLEYSLQNSRLDEAEQTAIVKSLVGKNASPDARADFVAEKVDAAVVWEPDVAEALDKRENSHVIVSTKEARKLIADIMVAREDFIRDHRDVIQAFVEGWVVDGTVKANREPEKVVTLLMDNEPLYKELGPEVTRQNLATVRWADLADNTEMFNLDGQDQQPLFDSIFSQAAKSWVSRGYISAPVAPSVARDTSFLREVYQRNPVERNSYVPPAPSPEVATEPAFAEKRITVNFASNSAVLDAAARQVIDEQVSLLAKAMSGAYLRVEGNTDNLGNPEFNRELSQRRAKAVVDYLINQHHLPENEFVVIGNGPDKPIEPGSNDTPEGRAKNRRTDISLIKR